MNKQWISCLADGIEKKHGKETRSRIFGDINSMANTSEYLSAWFENFTNGLDGLNDKEFLQQMMASHHDDISSTNIVTVIIVGSNMLADIEVIVPVSHKGPSFELTENPGANSHAIVV